jgi:hypothetical protein
MDWEPYLEGPPKATVIVEALSGGKVKWTFREPGDRGEVLGTHLYEVYRMSDGERPFVYSYFSLVDGTKVLVKNDVKLTQDEFVALDSSLSK